jgi:hypothetical protein
VEPEAGGQTALGTRSECLTRLIAGRFRSSRIYLQIPCFMSNMTPTHGRPPQTYIMKVSWPIQGIPIASTKILLIHLCFYLFCPNSLFQTPIMFSLYPGGGWRCSRWPCQPRTTLRQALPDVVPPKGVIQGDRREFAHHPGADCQTITRRSQAASPRSSMVRPPAPASLIAYPKNRGRRPCFSYTRTCSCSGGESFSVNTLIGDSAREECLVRSKPRHSTPSLRPRSATRTPSRHRSTTCQKKSARRSRNARRLERRRRCKSF